MAWRLAIGVVLILHGIGHVLGILAATSLGGERWNARSWLLTGTLGDGVAKAVSIAAWLVGLVLFVVAGFALLEIGFPETWWKTLAVCGAGLSLMTLGLFWNAFPTLVPNKIGAIAVNLAVLAGLLVAAWPAEEMLIR